MNSPFLLLEYKYPRRLNDLARHIEEPGFPLALRRFLYELRYPDSNTIPDLDDCPEFDGQIDVFHSAVARFYAPSDLCGAGGMYRERIRSNPLWYGIAPRRDTVFVVLDEEEAGMRGMVIAQVLLFFSFKYARRDFACALVHWLVCDGDEPDADTGMWTVRPEFEGNRRTLQVIHLDSIARGAHLLPVYGRKFLPEGFDYTYALKVFPSYFVNRYADHHTHEFLTD